MQVRGISLGEGEFIASQVGVRLYNVRVKDEGFDAKLLPLHDGSRKYQRKPTPYRNGMQPKMRYINAVCYHGYRAFMTAVFEQNPDAFIKTGMAKYRGVQQFCAGAEDVAERVVGWEEAGTEYADLCDCYFEEGSNGYNERERFYALCATVAIAKAV